MQTISRQPGSPTTVGVDGSGYLPARNAAIIYQPTLNSPVTPMPLSLDSLLNQTMPARLLDQPASLLGNRALVEAVVLSSTRLLGDQSGGGFRIQLGNSKPQTEGQPARLEIIAKQPLPVGTRVQLQLQNDNTATLLRVSSAGTEPASADNTGRPVVAGNDLARQRIDAQLRQSLPLQQPLRELIPLLTTILRQPPAELNRETLQQLNTLLNRFPSAEQMQDPAQLRQAIRDSGLFTEAKILQSLVRAARNGQPLVPPAAGRPAPENNPASGVRATAINPGSNTGLTTAANPNSNTALTTAATPNSNTGSNAGVIPRPDQPSVAVTPPGRSIPVSPTGTAERSSTPAGPPTGTGPGIRTGANERDTSRQTGANNTAPNQDLKQLLQQALIGIQRQLASRQPATGAEAGDHLTGPTLPSSLPLTTALLNTLKTEAKTAETDDTLDIVLRQLGRQLLASLSRTQLNQMETLTNRAQYAPDNQGPQNSWVLELPIMRGEQVDNLRLRIDQEAAGREAADGVQQWTVMLNFDLHALGKMSVQLRVVQRQVSATIWSQRAVTHQLVESEVNTLADKLTAIGVSVNQVECLLGEPPAAARNLHRRLLDVRT